jgi:hypothetical protein
MNDPRVSALVYRVKHDETVNYDKPARSLRDSQLQSFHQCPRSALRNEGAFCDRRPSLSSPVTMSVFDQGISGAMMTSIAVSPSMAKMTATASVESD